MLPPPASEGLHPLHLIKLSEVAISTEKTLEATQVIIAIMAIAIAVIVVHVAATWIWRIKRLDD